MTMTTKPNKPKSAKTPVTKKPPVTTKAAAATPVPAKAVPAKPAAPPLPPCVRLAYRHPGAQAVFLAGTFNQWRPTATPMQCTGADCWSVELELPPGIYEYRFIVDGAWVHDPASAETVPNPFGGLNSVVRVVAAA